MSIFNSLAFHQAPNGYHFKILSQKYAFSTCTSPIFINPNKTICYWVLTFANQNEDWIFLLMFHQVWNLKSIDYNLTYFQTIGQPTFNQHKSKNHNIGAQKKYKILEIAFIDFCKFSYVIQRVGATQNLNNTLSSLHVKAIVPLASRK